MNEDLAIGAIMKTLKIFGASDDLIETSGIDGCDEFCAWPNSDRYPYAGRMIISADNQQICVHAIYSGGWSFAVSSENEHDDFRSMPDWIITRDFGKDVEFSETLQIQVPDNAKLAWISENLQ